MKPVPIEQRLWSRVARSPDGCWEWLGAKTKRGYGVIKRDGAQTTVHRVVLELILGRSLGLNDSCHTCDNPGCVRPSHLFEGSRRENMQDALRKGRHRPNRTHHRRGEDNGNSKLCSDHVCEIRRLRAEGGTCRAVAARFSVSPDLVAKITRRKRWRP